MRTPCAIEHVLRGRSLRLLVCMLAATAHAHAAIQELPMINARTPPSSTNSTWLRPEYHFSQAGSTHGPCGLMYRQDELSNETHYHAFDQNSERGNSGWGHTLSSDLVHWERLTPTGIQGTMGGAIVLPVDFAPPPQLAGAKAVAFSSPLIGSTPSAGVSLYFSADTKLENWTLIHNENSADSNQLSPCVICPDDIPASFAPGFIGGTYAWLESNSAEPNAAAYTFYALVASERCPDPQQPWCANADLNSTTAQTFLFKSADLVHWDFRSVFALNSSMNGSVLTHIEDLDTFSLDDDTNLTNSTQAFVYAADGHSPQWQIGSLDAMTMMFAATASGVVDRGGGIISQQSLTMPDDSGRVSIGWIDNSVSGSQAAARPRVSGVAPTLYDAGSLWSAQTLPRVVAADEFGLRYEPWAGLELLHSEYRFLHAHTVDATDPAMAFPDVSKWGNRVHMRLDIQLRDGTGGPDASSLSSADPEASLSSSLWLELLGGAVSLNVSYEKQGSDPELPDRQCDGSIHNNTDVTGRPLSDVVVSPENRNPAWCQRSCCQNSKCTGWVFTDTQPGKGPNAGKYMCWLKQGAADGLKSGQHCLDDGGGHCWAGLQNATPHANDAYTVHIAGNSFTQNTRPFAYTLGKKCGRGRRAKCTPPGEPYPGYVRLPTVDIFVDGAIVEAFFNGEVSTTVVSEPVVHGMEIRMGAGGGGAIVKLDAWRMSMSLSSK
jgi:hypothetical protein